LKCEAILVFFPPAEVYDACRLSTSERKTRPSLAKTKAGVGMETFGVLLCAAVEDPSAAQGLALAYSELDRDLRQHIIDEVICDAPSAGVNASLVLAPLLAIEEDVEIARNIASAMSASGGTGLGCDRGCRVLLGGDTVQGSALLARPLYGRFVELLGLHWNTQQGITHSFYEPLARLSDMQRHARRLPTGATPEEIPLAYAVDVIAGALWHHRRLHGELPQVVARFADLFERAI
jgi:hypothetical protein